MSRAFSGSRVVVVGGAGFIGGNLVRRLLREGCDEVVVVDNFLSSEREAVPGDPRIRLVVGSIADDAVLGELPESADVVFHLATFHGNQSSIARPLDDHANNLLTTLKLFAHLAGGGAGRIVYASTGCALAAKGDVASVPVVEDGPIPLDFDSPYQISKVAGEMYALFFHRHAGLPVVRARFQNVYGPGEILGAGSWRGTQATVWRNVVPTFVYRGLKGEPLLVHGDGEATRDFVYVEDIVDGLLACATADGVEGDVFNLASGVETTIRALADTVNEVTGNQAGVESLPPRTWDRSLHRVGSTEKASQVLGFRARTTFQDGIRATVDWTRDSLDLIERCIERHRGRLPVEAAR